MADQERPWVRFVRVASSSSHRSKSSIAFSVSLAVVILASCGRGQLARDQAAELLKKRPEFSKEQKLLLVIRPMVDFIGAEGSSYRAAAQLGLITITSPHGEGNQGTTAITAKGKEATAGPGWQFDGSLLRIPVAAPELIDVTGVVQSEKEAQVDFTWRLRLTDTGKDFESHGLSFANLNPIVGGFVPAVPHTAKASFRQYDDGWRVEEVDMHHQGG
jgi:hypothetical protein